MEIVWFKCLMSTILFIVIGWMAYRVVRRVTESNFKESDNSLAAERKRLIKYIKCLLFPIWIFYEGYILFGSDKSWIGDLFTNFFAAGVVLFFQEMKQVDNKDCGLQYYGLFGLLLLAGWLVINLAGLDICSESIMTIAYEKFGVPIGVGLFVWAVDTRLKNR